MGYSAEAQAYEAMMRISEQCVKQTGSSNVFETNGNKYFFEHGREQPDGAVTGSVHMFVGEHHARRAGTFRIEPGGIVSRGPKWMKEAAKQKRTSYGL